MKLAEETAVSKIAPSARIPLPWVQTLTQPSKDRLFDDYQITAGTNSVRIVVASGAGKSKLCLFADVNYLASSLAALVDESVQALSSQCMVISTSDLRPSSRTADVGNLLDGNRRCWIDWCGMVSRGPAASRPLNPVPLGHTRRRAFDYLLDWPDAAAAFAVPAKAEDQLAVFEELFQSLETLSNIPILEGWLRGIAVQEVRLPKGVPPDSPALSLIKRLLDIDFSIGFYHLQHLFKSASKTPFHKGYFQLSLAGALLSKNEERVGGSDVKRWARVEIRRLRAANNNAFGDDSLDRAVIASLLSLVLIYEDNTIAGAKSFEVELEKELLRVCEVDERRYFLQFLSDSLSQHITVKNLPVHWIKLIVFCKYIADEKSVVWPRSGILGILRDTFLTPGRKVARK